MNNSGIIAILVGVCWVQQLKQLPDALQWALLLLLWLLCLYRRIGLLLWLLTGMMWAAGFGQWRLQQILPVELAARELSVQGYIASLPQQQDHRLSFDFVVTQPSQNFPHKLRLSWYQPYPETIAAGQSWQLTVKLKPPHGRLNLGSFDYEAWLFANQIGATGYVREKPAAQQLPNILALGQYLAMARQGLAEKLDTALPDSEFIGVIKALTLGSQSDISQQQWQVFRQTGTTHLVVISGSHISLIAGLIFVLVRRAWARWGCLQYSPQRMAALVSWWLALVYSLLAGWTVPTQRALVMLTVALLALVWQRQVSPWRILLLALLAVLLFDPLAVLSAGFWLSFGAVALLMYVSVGRLKRPNYWREAGLAQWATSLGLAPLLIMIFQQLSLIAPLANLIAVPLIGLVLVPLALLAVLLLFIAPTAASGLLWLVDVMLQALWWLLQQLAQLPWSSIYCAQPSGYGLVLAGLGVLLALTPKGTPARYLWPFLCLPLLFVKVEHPKTAEVWLTMLDVGQGLALVVQTAEHSMVFDTGAKYSEQADMGESVILPYLRNQTITQLDALVVSHGDNDHSGGAASLLAEMPVSQLYSSEAEWAEAEQGSYCQAGLSWQWDEVSFSFLSPGETAFAKQNDNSCVLQIRTAQQQLLLTGDIEQNAEIWLRNHYPDQLASTVLIAPHHGSKTSSTWEFVNQVQPQLVLIPAGYANRFNFPHPSVIKRYESLGAQWFSSAQHGAVSVKTDGSQWTVTAARQQMRRYWMGHD